MASFEQNKKNKKWSVRFRDTINGVEKNMRLSGYKTKKEAQAAYIEYENKRKLERDKEEQGKIDSAKNMYFEALKEKYLEHVKTRNKYSSWYSTQNKIEKNIAPYFDDKQIKDITPLEILKWQQSIDALSFNYKRGLRALLNSIFKFGERYYDIKNVVAKVEPFRNLEAKKEMLHWTLDEFQKFIEKVENYEYEMFFRFLYITGCRKGEALALSWNDFLLDNGKVVINKSMTRKAQEGAYAITTPKNVTSNRTIDLPENFIEQMRNYRKWQQENKKKFDFVFGGERPFAETTTDRLFRSACEKADVKRIRIHDLRHSCASLLISEGVNIVAVSKRLGHKNIEQTLNTYSHMMPDDVTKMLKVLQNI